MDKKFVLASVTIWGLLITAAGMFNIPIPFTKEEGEQLIHLVAEVVGLVLVGIGRIRASKPLGFGL